MSNLAYRFVQRYQPDYPVEFLLPQFRKSFVVEEFPYIAEGRENPAWSEAALRAKIHEVGPWDYYFAFSHDLDTKLYGTFNETSANFHRCRSKLISETVVELLGEEAGQATVLDLACNCGVMTLDIAYRGVKQVTGVDVRESNLRQAAFLRDYYRIENAAFEQGDVYAMREGLTADVVLCLGILYHVVRPVDLIEYCYRTSRRFVVIDTHCLAQAESYYRVVTGRDATSTIEGTRAIEFLPTYRAVIDTMHEAGFKQIIEVVGQSTPPAEDYSNRTRRCFIGFKQPYGDAIAARLTPAG